jgi:hypothetical protein
MKYLLSCAALVLCQGCTTLSNGVLNQHPASSAYNPQTIETVDANKYMTDKQLSFKKVQAESESSMAEQHQIIKFRDCLMKKGYVLLS